ncbi:Probable L,D-transpeptidase YnhG precursor [Kingella potus]|uniref:Probable L,D-transpeptidase YnhG n=1 Tax=Kingella potus TaxID=265175 RepID=A0A377R096_9NEIS|nr:L,D-transpeptidase [Kingella potus]UOP01004.1 L,D-transpeptidase [Kingella potus]STR00672.1 Probable L,D-transpeptidase YnhG precursor [Kingella potus]
MKKLGFALLTLSASSAFAATSVPDVSPIASGTHVVINIPQQRLFLYSDGKLSKIYPVAVGKAMTQTNIGSHKIGAKAYNPTWHIPKSIQKELKNGVTSVPPGPKNPLGPVFVRLGHPKLGLGIHGTNAPSSVPGVRSHGCVRMKSPDALQFAKAVSTGSPADVIYQMAALNEDGAGNLWLAAYRDPYNKKNLDTASLRKSIAAWSKASGKAVAAKRIDAVLKSRTGALNCITCGSAKGKISGELKSLAWTSGSGVLSKAQEAAKTTIPDEDQILPEGSEIEIDADADGGIQTLMPKSRTVSQPDAVQGEDNLF